MIDLHNHILPDWDDGPATFEKSYEMARQAVAVGTTIMLATPHRYTGGKESLAHIVNKRVRELNDHLTLNGIPLTILPGVEIPIDFGISDEVRGGHLNTLGAGKYVLLEPPFTSLTDRLLPAIKEIFDNGLGAVIAHPERNSEVQKAWMRTSDLSFIDACAKLGCIIQLTSGSVTGRFGHSAQTVSRAISLRRDWKIVIASDSHDPKERTPGFLAEARDKVGEWIDDPDGAEEMVTGLPAEIISS